MCKLNRSAYWDNWKGLSIVAVVIIHASNTAFDFPATSFNFYFGLGLRQLITFAVPLFLSIAGYFAANSKSENYVQYYKKRMWRIVLPYAIWTAIYLIVTTPSTLPDAEEIIKGYLFGTGIGIGYFVIVLIQAVAITPILLSITNIKTHIYIMVILTAVGLSFTYYFSIFNTSSFFSNFPGKGILFFVWYPFYHGGFFISRYKNIFKVELINPHVIFILLMSGLILAFGEGLFWTMQGHYKLGASQIKLSSFIVSIFVFLLSVNLEKKQSCLDKYNVLTWLGLNSFAIYLTHLLFLRFFLKLSIIKQIYFIQPLYIFLLALLSLTASSAFIYLARKIFPSKAGSMILG